MARPIPATTTTTVTPGTSATAATPVAPGPHHGPSGLRRWLLLLMVSLGLLLVTVDITILLTALPVLTHDLHASTTEGLWIVNAYPLFSTGLLLGAGTLGDRIGHRRTFLAGLLIFGLASLLAAFSGSVGMLVAARILQAVGASAMLPATLALIRVGFDDERERALAISIWAALSLVGAILGPLLGGWLLAHFHWGSLFLINVPVIALAGVLGAGAETLTDAGFAAIFPSIAALAPLEETLAKGGENLERTARQIAAVLALGGRL